MKILVTGSEGFIGGHLTQDLRECGHETFGFDLAIGNDASDAEQLQRASEGMDVVVHLAAQVGRLFGEDDVKKTIADNVAMTANVAQVCGEEGIPLVYASTSEVYGDIGMLTACEDRGTYNLPHNAYGLSKRQGEEFCKLYAPTRLTIWRISMPYGPGLPAGRGRAAMINFLYNALHGLPITVHKASERSWCWIGDTVRAMRMTIEGEHYGTWNIGRDDNATPMVNVAEKACELAGADYSLIKMINPPPRQTVVKRLSTHKIHSIGWEPWVDLDEGMERTLEWVKTLPAPLAAAA